ncbi:MAG: sce7726 family protein [Sulfurimonas sp.]|uniref:sce7726 family protein n=1 Tax=Sulfurimonas sp. TaxID=2022749 RepID=UPI00262D0969|nr:sce7726 family protein [Sulfurimonas sp.]MDD5373920.1 sce7726 family protein [Sulfurimonas sp.]
MATEIKNLTLEKALELLGSGYVLSKKNFRWDCKIGDKVCDKNICQIFQSDNEFYYLHFDSYGNKIKNKCHTVREDEILGYLNPHQAELITSHKQKISKKSLNDNIVDERTAKYLVYEWLLKQYPNEDDVIIPELSLGDRRADYIAFGKNETCIIEIKSEVDTIDRLQEQINKYISYGSYVYIAIHANKIKSLTSLSIPDFVGIMEIGSGLKVIKKAKKQKIDLGIFTSYLNYNDFKGMASGLKQSSKFEKEDIESIFYSNFTKKQQAEYAFKNMKKRHTRESEKRKELHRSGEKTKAIDNATSIGVNRMTNNYDSLSLKNIFKVDENYLVKLLDMMQNSFNKVYKNSSVFDIALDDKMLYRTLSIRYKLAEFHNTSRYFRLKYMLEKKDILLKNQEEIIDYINDEMSAIIKELKNDSGLYLFKTQSKKTHAFFTNKLSSRGIEYKILQPSEMKNLHRINREHFADKQVLIVVEATSSFYHVDREINQQRLWIK